MRKPIEHRDEPTVCRNVPFFFFSRLRYLIIFFFFISKSKHIEITGCFQIGNQYCNCVLSKKNSRVNATKFRLFHNVPVFRIHHMITLKKYLFYLHRSYIFSVVRIEYITRITISFENFVETAYGVSP